MTKFWSSMAKRAKPYIPGEQVNKQNIIKLNTNENPYPPSPNVISAINGEVNESLRLYPSPTMDELRSTIASHYGVTADNVFVGNGSDEILGFSFMGFFEPGKPIRFPDITYSFYPVYAKVFDIDYETVPLREDFTINKEDFFNAEGGVIFPNPNAPTSLYLGLADVEEIVQQNKDTVVIVDEAYIDFATESAVNLTKKYDNLLVIQTMSKSRSLAGLRVGLAIGNEQLINALVRMKDSFNSYPVDRLAQAGAIEAMKDVAYFEKTTEKIISTRERTIEALTALGFNVLSSAANFVFASHETVAAESLYEKLRERDILIRYFGTEPIENYVRISIGTDDEMDQFLRAVETIIAE